MKKLKVKNVIIAIIILILIIIISGIGIFMYNLTPVDKNDTKEIEIVIPSGSSTKKISEILKNKKLIRSKGTFLLYVKLKNIKSLKASTYTLKKSMSVKEIINTLEEGNKYNPDEIKITFKEGINMRKIAKAIEEKTNNSYDDVLKKLSDTEYIKSLINDYWFLTDKILDKNIYYSLEGYLYPDTYIFKNKDVTIEKIFKDMLDNMDKVLTPYKDEITSSKKDIHDIITMASIVEQEGTKVTHRKDISSVFYNRLSVKMNLGSDATTYYAFKVDMGERDLYTKELNTYNPYNTRGPKMEGKLPVGPISIPSKESIEAAIHPSNTEYLFFVTDKHRNVFFSKTYSEHQKKIQEIKQKGDWLEW